jgi:AraC-like DNA-binding protein
MDHTFRFLEFDGNRFAAFIESRTENEHTEYMPFNVLYYVQQGQFNVRQKNKLYQIPKGDFCIVRKLTRLSYFKTWDDDEECAIINAMALNDDLIKEVIKELGYKAPEKEIHEPVINLGNNAILLGLYSSLSLYLGENQAPDKHLIYLKTKEAILGIVQSDPNHLALFYEFSKSVKADLKEFMGHHMTSTLPLDMLADLSGRSLSTFNRDFRKIFNTSPHRWLLKNRLTKAREILLTTDKTSSDVYLDLGFKDLAHFSRSFKKEFGVPPSELVK